MAVGVGEYLVKQANRRGLVLFVDTDHVLKAYPDTKLTQAFFRLLTAHYYKVRDYIITDAVTQE